MQHRFTDNFKVVDALIPQVVNADTAISAIDTLGYDQVVVQFHLGNSADTLSGTNKIELEIEHGDTTTTSDCADTDLSASVTGTNTGTAALIDAPSEDSTTVTVEYIGGKRYIKPVCNFSGTHSTGTPIGITVLLGNPRVSPAA